MSNQSSPYLYLLCRNDMDSMNGGKAIAHGAHAANQFTHEIDKILSQPMTKSDVDTNDRLQNHYNTWLNSANGFGTTISLSMSLPEMQTVVYVAKSMGFVSALTIDPTYPYILHKEYANLINHPEATPPISMGNGMMMCYRDDVTCGYVFGLKSDLKPIVGNFKMVQ